MINNLKKCIFNIIIIVSITCIMTVVAIIGNKKIDTSVIESKLLEPQLTAGVFYVTNVDFNNDNLTVTSTAVSTVGTTLESLNESMGQEIIENGLNEDSVDEISYNVPINAPGCHNSTYTHMNYKKITSKSTNQYAVNYDSNVYTDADGCRRVPCSWDNEDYYLVTIGKGYEFSAGDYIAITFSSGKIIKAIVGDMKATADTDPTERYQKYDGSVVELIVDEQLINRPQVFEENGGVISIDPLIMG